MSGHQGELPTRASARAQRAAQQSTEPDAVVVAERDAVREPDAATDAARADGAAGTRHGHHAHPGGDGPGSGHGHGHSHGPAPRSSRTVRLVLAAFLVPALVATVVGLVLFWPHGGPARGSIDTTADTAGKVYGTVTGPIQTGNLVPVELDGSGEQILVIMPPEYMETGVGPGDQLKILHIPQAASSGSEYVFMDFVRTVPIALLAIAYAVVVLAVARWRGLAAIAGLAISFGVVVLFTLPALLVGTNAIAVALLTSTTVMFVVLYLAHGFNARTSTALLGTLLGLVITALLAGWAVDAANIAGVADEYSLMLPAYAPDVNIRGIALCGIVLAGLGVLNDVTITQASSVWELRAASPGMTRLELFSRGMRIGRDHIASTVYTIAFAYLGAALPMLLVVSMINMGLGETLTSGEIAQEVVRTLVGSIGLVLAIPLTTAIAAVAVGGHGSLAPSAPDDGAPGTGAAPAARRLGRRTAPEGPQRSRGLRGQQAPRETPAPREAAPDDEAARAERRARVESSIRRAQQAQEAQDERDARAAAQAQERRGSVLD